MDKRETSKIVPLDGRKFRINKFDAMTGSYIAYKLMGEMLPMGLSAKVGAPSSSNIMSKADFVDLQKDCLKACAEMLPAGDAQVMNEDGTWGVNDLEKDAKTVLALTIHVLTFNIMGFFDESLLSSMAEAMSIILPQNAKTSTVSSTPQL